MSEQYQNLINWNSCQKQLYSERVTEHVGVTAFASTVGILYIGDLEELAETALIARPETIFCLPL